MAVAVRVVNRFTDFYTSSMTTSSEGIPPDPQRATGVDVARLAGVSKTAVSQVFSGTGRISPDTARRVRAAAAELGYSPAHSGRSLRTGRTGLLSMIIPQAENPYYMEIFAGGRQAALERGYTLNLLAADDIDSLRRTVQLLGSGVADGVVLTGEGGIGELAADIRGLRRRGIAVSVTHDHSPEPDVPAVRVDFERGAMLAVRHLAGLGHRRIAHVGTKALGPLRPGTAPEGVGDGRFAGYLRGLREAGIEFDPALVYIAAPSAAGGAAAAASITARPGPEPTAVFAFNDLVALGLLNGLAGMDVRVPRDISVVGFDGIALAEYSAPSLTTVSHPRHEVGHRAVSLLCDRLEGCEPSAIEREVTLAPSLVVRGSTAAPKG